MSINSLKHRIHKRMELQNYKRDFSDIGSFIKRKRKELNITQDEVSYGICSISYLSKIENNQIIPNDFYIQEIMEKLDIDQAIYSISLRDKDYVKKIIHAFYYMDDQLMESLYNEMKEVEHNVVINLCKLGYTVYFNLEDINQYVMMLEHVVNNMTEEEIRLYLYFSSIYFMEREKYKTALEFILLQDTLPQKNAYLTAMFKEVSFLVKQRLHLKNTANDDYYHAMNMFQSSHNVVRSLRLAMYKIGHLYKEHPHKAMEMLQTIKYPLLSKKEQDYYFYTKAQIYFELQLYQESTLTLKQINEESSFYMRKMTLLYRICQIENDTQMMDQIVDILSRYTPHKEEMKCKIYYHYLVQSNDDKKEYLRDVAIPFSIRVEDFERLHEYTNAIMDICIASSRYKEATQYFHKYQREVKKIQKLMYEKTS